jgi:hypothetical protein
VRESNPVSIIAQGLHQLAQVTQLLVSEGQASGDERAAEHTARERRETE